MKGQVLLAGKRMKGEPMYAVVACNDYLRMGAGRGYGTLHAEYMRRLDADPNATIPSRRLRTISGWGSRFDWIKRAELFDAEVERLRNAKAVEAMTTGYALPHERVMLLNQLITKLAHILSEHDRGMYGEHVRSIGSGQAQQVVRDEVFRKDELAQLRGLLDDVAKETGGREKRVNVEASGLAGLLSNAEGFDIVDSEFDVDIEDATFEDI
jgi:hypothetical protein